MPGLPPAAVLSAWERGLRGTPLQRSAELLASGAGVSAPDAAGWDVGSRDAVLAGVLADLAGATVWACTGCAGCGAALDVPVDLTPIARLPARQPGETFRIEVHGVEVTFRLPTSADLAAVRGTDPDVARRALLAACVAGGELTDEVAGAVDAAMAELSPAGAVQIAVGCPDCAATTTAALDVGVLLWSELAARATALLRDVHLLATAYGWTEPEVLALSPQRRAAYLELVGT